MNKLKFISFEHKFIEKNQKCVKIGGIALVISLLATTIILLTAEHHCHSFWFDQIEPYFPYEIVLSVLTVLVGITTIYCYLNRSVSKNCIKGKNLSQEDSAASSDSVPKTVSLTRESPAAVVSPARRNSPVALVPPPTRESPAAFSLDSVPKTVSLTRESPTTMVSPATRNSPEVLVPPSTRKIPAALVPPSIRESPAAFRPMQQTVDDLITNAPLKREQNVILKNSLEYAILHSEIAHRTHNAIAENKEKQWKKILEDLHQKVRIRYSSSESSFLLDCSLELRRLRGETTELEVYELSHMDFLRNRSWVDSLIDVIKEAFDCEYITVFNYLFNCSRKDYKIYLERNKRNPHEIFGGLCVQIHGDGILDISFFCRKAAAIKIPSPKIIEDFLKTNADYQLSLPKPSHGLVSYISSNGWIIRPSRSRPASAIVNELIAKASIKKKQDITLQNSFEYAMLYYELSVRTDNARTNGKEEQWQKILEDLHQNVVIHFPSGNIQRLLDCSFELARLKGRKIELEVARLTKDEFETNKKCSDSLSQAFAEAFEDLCGRRTLAEFFNNPKDRVYVGRNRHNRDEVFGCICLREERPGVYLCANLCKIACAPKIGLANAIANFLKEDRTIPHGSLIRCEVLVNNSAAIKLYQQFGFIIESTNTDKDEHFHVMTMQL